MQGIKYLITITHREFSEQYLDSLKQNGINFVTSTLCQGTAKDSVLGLLDIEKTDKVMIEANHDLNLLAMGKYPDALKRRIRGDRGHLCNEKAGELAVSLFKEGTKKFLLGHLSEENNHPDLAYVTVREMLIGCGAKEGLDFVLKMTYPTKTGEIL